MSYGVLAIDDAVDQEKLFAAAQTVSIKGRAVCTRSIKDHYGFK